MTGIQFITDEKGRKNAAIIDLKEHRAPWEDIEDVLVSRSRSSERYIHLGVAARRGGVFRRDDPRHMRPDDLPTSLS